MKYGIVKTVLLGFILAGTLSSAMAESFVGVVKTLEGSAVIERGEQRIPVVTGIEVLPTDTITTDRNGYVGVVFSDDTRISMGPNTKVAVDQYRFAPLENQFSFVLRLFQGTVSFLSGQIAKLAPQSVKLVLPEATIGVRGTHVLMKVD